MQKIKNRPLKKYTAKLDDFLVMKKIYVAYGNRRRTKEDEKFVFQ